MHKRFPIEEISIGKTKKSTIFDPVKDVKKCLYLDNNGIIIQPSNHVERSIIKGATQIKWQGKKTYKNLCAQSIIVEEEFIYFLQPKNPENYEINIDTIVNPNTKCRSPIARPIWKNWEFEFHIISNADEHINNETMKNILVEAGKEGIGTYRLSYGKYEVIEFKEVHN